MLPGSFRQCSLKIKSCLTWPEMKLLHSLVTSDALLRLFRNSGSPEWPQVRILWLWVWHLEPSSASSALREPAVTQPSVHTDPALPEIGLFKMWSLFVDCCYSLSTNTRIRLTRERPFYSHHSQSPSDCDEKNETRGQTEPKILHDPSYIYPEITPSCCLEYF